ncbi:MULTISPECIES: DUF6151 family protein [Ramlibacter]|uniref:DUF6151 family protein n=1 Tax=Ramlibacter TaxID=174951 RepID=UPI001C67AC14|nr:MULTISPECIES: DUF6151 family protein [Ramlibacter]
MNYPLRCQCGAIEGFLTSPGAAGRAVCYCRDCQAFARYLGTPEGILNDQGGTDIIATLPRHVHLTKGAERLLCVRLSDKGMLRWYASCCRTPIGNTPPDPKLPYVGLVRTCLPGTPSELDGAFGPARVSLNTGSANGQVSPTRIAAFFAILKIMRNVLGARLSGAFKENPFFRPGSAVPIVVPHVLKPDERHVLRGDT